MYKFVEWIREPFLWLAFYGYGITCSLFIDLITVKICKKAKQTVRISLYIVAGYAIFNYKGIDTFTVIAGSIGALCAMMFLLGTYVARKKPHFKYAFALIVPLVFMVLTPFDFTIKNHWVEIQTDSSFAASFDYFNGAHPIPIHANEGQTIVFSVHFINENGGQGYHVLDEGGQLVPMTENNDGTMGVTIEETGLYKIVLTGNGLKGKVKVIWDVL